MLSRIKFRFDVVRCALCHKSAAEAEMRQAKPLEHNQFKVELGKRAIVSALQRAIGS